MKLILDSIKKRSSLNKQSFTRWMSNALAIPSFAPPLLGACFLGGFASTADAQSEKIVPTFKRVVVDENPPARPYYKMVGDVTGDGNPDIIIAGRAGDSGPIVMYSHPDWKKTLLADGGFDRGVRGSLADVNSNGRLDIVMGGVWFENPGTRGAEWKVHHIDQQRVHDVLAADLTGNGRPDVVSRAQSAFGRAEGRTGNVIHLYYQEELNTWRKETLECPHGEGITIADLDGDGKLDIVIGGEWFRNAAGKWIRHVFAAEWAHPHTKVEVGDINGDGRLDIVLTPAELLGQRYRISWFESPAGDKTRPWKEHAIVPDVECVVHALALGDYNQDGTLDVAYAEMHQGEDPDEVVVMFNYENGARWEKLIIDTHGSHDIVAADLDGDGDLDLVGANHAGVHPLVIWENQLISRPSPSPSQP